MGIVLNKKKHFFLNKMGRVRTKTVKRASRAIIGKYYGKLTKDFHFNKRIIDDVTVIQSKRMRNKIAGFTTHLMKRIEKGKVRDPNRQHRMERPSCQVTHQRARHQATRQPTQTTKTSQTSQRLIYGGLWSLIIV